MRLGWEEGHVPLLGLVVEEPWGWCQELWGTVGGSLCVPWAVPRPGAAGGSLWHDAQLVLVGH